MAKVVMPENWTDEECKEEVGRFLPALQEHGWGCYLVPNQVPVLVINVQILVDQEGKEAQLPPVLEAELLEVLSEGVLISK